MHLQPKTEEALDTWARPSTCYTDHEYDMESFYRFADQYQRDHGFTMDEAGLRDLIESKTNSAENENLCEVIFDRVSLAYKILDFLKAPGR